MINHQRVAIGPARCRQPQHLKRRHNAAACGHHRRALGRLDGDAHGPLFKCAAQCAIFRHRPAPLPVCPGLGKSNRRYLLRRHCKCHTQAGRGHTARCGSHKAAGPAARGLLYHARKAFFQRVFSPCKVQGKRPLQAAALQRVQHGLPIGHTVFHGAPLQHGLIAGQFHIAARRAHHCIYGGVKPVHGICSHQKKHIQNIARLAVACLVFQHIGQLAYLHLFGQIDGWPPQARQHGACQAGSAVNACFAAECKPHRAAHRIVCLAHTPGVQLR